MLVYAYKNLEEGKKMQMFDILVVLLGGLLAIGAVIVIVRVMMKPVVLVLVFAALGWVLYLNTIGYIPG
jgi:hypothetical protein